MFWLLHSFVNLFAGGRSDSKTILFPLYVLVLVFFIHFKKDIFTRLSLWWGIVLTGLLYVYGFISHLLLFRYYNLPLNSFAITGNNNEISSTTFYHIHESKGVIGFILSKFGINHLQTTDAGGAYVGLLPSWWFIIGTVLLVGVIVFAVISIYKFSRYYSTGNKSKNFIFILFYAVISFSLVKTAIDGGVLTPSLLALGFGIYLFRYIQKEQDSRKILLSVFIMSIVSFILILLFPDWSSGIILMQMLATLLLLTTLSLFILGAPKRVYILSSITLLLISWWLAGFRDQEIFRYGTIRVDKAESYFSYNIKKHLLEKKISDINTNIISLVKSEDKNLSYAPISVPGKTCSESGTSQIADAFIQTKFPMQTIKTPYLNIFIKTQTRNGFWWKNEATIVMQSCLPEVLTIIDDTLKEHGFNFYVMVDPVFYDEPINH